MEERKEGLEKIKIKIDTTEGELKKNIGEGGRGIPKSL